MHDTCQLDMFAVDTFFNKYPGNGHFYADNRRNASTSVQTWLLGICFTQFQKKFLQCHLLQYRSRRDVLLFISWTLKTIHILYSPSYFVLFFNYFWALISIGVTARQGGKLTDKFRRFWQAIKKWQKVKEIMAWFFKQYYDQTSPVTWEEHEEKPRQ